MAVPFRTACQILSSLLVAATNAAWTLDVSAQEPARAAIEFNRDIRPILAEHCYACHGPDANKREANLRLDTRDGALAARDAAAGDKPAIVAGKPDASELVRRIESANPDERMPPPASGKTLSAAQTKRLRDWIVAGAPYEKHWSLMPPERRPLPTVQRATWVAQPIDRFILARLEHEKLEPAADADPRTLVRRLSYDLLGLPPTAEDVAAFVADPSLAHYEQLVDRYLASPQYGERMTVFWLDVVRYADTGGYHSDNHRDLTPYRDYILSAFNSHKPFDQFTIEQLAGDLLPSATREQRIASGYNRLLQTTEEGGAQPKEYAAKYAADRVRNTATGWLGVTMGCCECHDHKFDPFTSRDFYRFEAIFADVGEKPVGRQDQTPVPTAEQQRALQQLDEQLKQLRAEPDQAAQKTRLEQLEKQRAALVQQFPSTLVTVSVPPRTIRILPRGNWLDETGEIVEPGTPASLPEAGVSERRLTRLDFAQWLVARENPLTARVLANRLWSLAFGQGLCRTTDDLGAQGEWPTHPELLDWLAVELRDSGWDIQRLQRTIVLSHTYRQSSQASPRVFEVDPQNRLLARQARYRLDAEFVRDNALAVSGLLSHRLGGETAKPYQPAGYWANLNFPIRDWTNDRGEGLYRRGLYTYWCRTYLHPSLLAFDAPSREECVSERPRSNTPLQALVMLNDPTYVEASRVLAADVIQQGGTGDVDRLAWLYQRVLQRSPRAEERDVLLDLVERHRARWRLDPTSAEALLKVGDYPRPAEVETAELAAWTSVARSVLNLHETITRN